MKFSIASVKTHTEVTLYHFEIDKNTLKTFY